MSYSRYKYYKYVYTGWTQPTLSSNGTVGGSSYAVRANSEYSSSYAAYRAFDKNNGTIWAESSVTNSGVLEFYSPVLLKVLSINITNRSESINTWRTGSVLGSTDGASYFTLASFTNSNATAGSTWSITINNKTPVKYIRIVTGSLMNSSHTLSVAEMKINAQQTSGRTIEGTSSDYDYKVDITKEYILCRKAKQYYKNWVQPTVTSNTSNGTISTTTQHPSHPPYIAFNGNRTGGDKYLSNTTSYGDLTWITPVAIKIKSCKIYTTQEGAYLNRYPRSIAIYGSDNGSSWDFLGSTSGYAQPSSGGYIEVTCSGVKEYKQTKWVFGANFGGDTGVGIGEIEITAGVSGTKYNYDYYETNIENYILITPNGTNYILKGK